MVAMFTEVAGEVPPACALLYIRRAGGSLEDAQNLYWAEADAVAAAAEPAAAAAEEPAAAETRSLGQERLPRVLCHQGDTL